MVRLPPGSTLPDTLFPYTPFCRSDSRAKAAALLARVLGVSWLGNIRALAHGNESVHAYCVTLFLAIGLHALSKARTGRGGIVDAALAAACGLAAAFSLDRKSTRLNSSH